MWLDSHDQQRDFLLKQNESRSGQAFVAGANKSDRKEEKEQLFPFLVPSPAT